jgi:hypothetical protein
VVFTGSPVLLEYYAGIGLQIQPLANFGKANAAWSACRSNGNRTCTTLRNLLDAMIALGSFTAWQYYFAFEGGAPPWMSAMAQAPVSRRSRAYTLTGVTRFAP